MTITIGDIITTTRGTRAAVVAPYPAAVPSWSIVDRAGTRTSVPESEIVAVESTTFGVAERVRLPFDGVGAVIADDGATVTVEVVNRVPLSGGNHHIWVGESFIGRGELVAANRL